MDLIKYRKKNFTIFYLCEVVFLTVLLVIFSFLGRYSETLYETTGYSEVLEDKIIYQLQPHPIFQFTPLVFVVIILIYSGILIYIRSGLKNPIKAKRNFKGLEIISYVYIAFAILHTIFRSTYGDINDIPNVSYTVIIINYTYGNVVGIVSSILIALDIRVWKSNFGLEKFYGNNDEIYK